LAAEQPGSPTHGAKPAVLISGPCYTDYRQSG
jgi:hypothetical protein